ncbi:zf-HC2 domain-containing protein [Streptomyces sp. ITFR-16]|uniref:zf-HC2 domain-containing protein n=1 Tax=Streptomyces sp. ITFR-16 TaxID=3075198 RepID=UPI00288B6F2B|nr:zf-HC2 domain-containing protein [Streptomyces sp. ITFR-16]WNI20876.1 zf-HC2 domain-containing protein [Streptomyces sp. ITFR-16]
MCTPPPHRDVGAYALGVLGAADAFRFEEHLDGCPGCRARAAEFGGVSAVLGQYARLTPPGVHPVVRAGPGLARRAAEAVAAGRRRTRRRRLALVAAAAVLAAGAPFAVPFAVPFAAPGGERATTRWTAGDWGSGMTAMVTADAREWGADVGLVVSGAPDAGVCALVAVGRDGGEETVATWSAGPGPQPLRVSGGAALRPAAIARFEVRTATGRRLLRLTR